MKATTIILDHNQIHQKIKRIAYQIYEANSFEDEIIIAGIQGVKKTSELIPMCHPLLINGVDIDIKIIDSENIEVLCEVTIEGKTGVEMEALTGANITCLTIYDMCKSISQKMVIKEVKLVEKTGGKSDIKNV